VRVSLLLVCVLTVAMNAAGGVREEPVIAIPITDAFLSDPVVRGFLSDVLNRGGNGYYQTESAAFLLLGENSTYRCEAWPFDGRLHQQEFRGRIPDRTIAIAHTHPANMPDASAHDRQTAIEHSVPIFVLTPLNIYLVTPRGETIAVVEGKPWSVNASSSTRCSVASARASRMR
jgi:hypothetical protein